MLDLAPLVLTRMPLRDRADWPAATSWFGGEPRLGRVPWPRGQQGGLPLHFLAQVDLVEVSRLRPEAGLPTQGSLAFFAGTDTGGGQVVFVPDHMAHPPVAPPDDTPPIYGDWWTDRCPGAVSVEAAPRSFRRWPIHIVPVDLPPGLNPMAAEQAAYEAISALGVTKNGFSVRSVAEMLPYDTWPTHWLAARLFMGSLLRSMGSMAKTREDKAALLGHAIAHRAGLDAGSPPPADRAAAIERADGVIARSRDELARLDASAPVFIDFVQTFEEWVGGKAPTQAMTPKEVTALYKHHYETRGRIKPWYKGYHSIEELASETLKVLLASAPHCLPPYALEHVDRVHLLPARGQYHLMLGAPARIQNAAEANADKVLLAQFYSDDMFDWMWGDVGVLQFWIGPDDLRRRDWSRVIMTAEGG